ncbi:MAG: hypothetical protein IH984_08975 [Planctomycetes bacterium]|nr:hypothetical protein [Planctomycetota bacterium]
MTTLTTQGSLMLEDLDQLIQSRERRINTLRRAEIELKAFQQLRKLAQLRGQAQRPQKAVIEFVSQQPGKYTSSQIAEILRDRILSQSLDRRRVVISTISNLVQEKQLSKDHENRLIIQEDFDEKRSG